MSTETDALEYPHDRPGVYSIQVVGRLDADWSRCLGGMSITYGVAEDTDGAPVTVLSGCLPDQAALFGVLNTLYNARYPLLFVKYLWPGKPIQSSQTLPDTSCF